jgi:hypothetical protein
MDRARSRLSQKRYNWAKIWPSNVNRDNETNSLQAPLQNIRPDLLPALLGPLSLSTSQVLWPPATRGRRGQLPGGATASHRIRKPYTSKGFRTPPRTPLPASLVKSGSKDKLDRRVNRQGYVELTYQFGERRLNSRTLSGNKYSYK